MKRLSFCIMLIVLLGCEQRVDTTGKPQKSSADSRKQMEANTAKTDYYPKALNFLKQGHIQNAVVYLEKQIKENPKDVRPYALLGKIYLKRGKLNDARTVLEIGSRVDPQRADIYFSLAQCYDRLGEKEKALENIRKSIAIYQAKNDKENFEKAVAVLKLLSRQPTVQQPQHF